MEPRPINAYRVLLDYAGEERYGTYRVITDEPDHDLAMEVFSALQGPGNNDIDWTQYKSIRVLEYFQGHPFLIAIQELH